MKNNYTEDMKQAQTGIQEFRDLIESDSLYVDKTEYIAQLLQMGRPVFRLLAQ